MFNVGGGELLVILLVALIVLGPTKLPEAARQFGRAMNEIRKLSTGFQREMRQALDDPVEAAARERGKAVTKKSTAAAAGMYPTKADTRDPEKDPPAAEDDSSAPQKDPPAAETAATDGGIDPEATGAPEPNGDGADASGD